MIHHTVGIDISKAHLDAYAAPEGRAARFSNDAAGFQKLIAWIGPTGRPRRPRAHGPLAPGLRGGPAEGRASAVRNQSVPGPVLR